MDGDDQISKPTMSGFFWKHDQKVFLITNWHCVTGVNPDTNKLLGMAPTHFDIAFKFMVTSNPNAMPVRAAEVQIELFDSEEKPVWLEHPEGQSVDVVAVPMNIPVPDQCAIFCLNEHKFQTDWYPGIGDDCFVVGYPEGISGPHLTPIWKRGSVATIPHFDVGEQPLFLLDTIGNHGLSGSPVIGKGQGIYKRTPGPLQGNDLIGNWQNFAGVYSGRMSNEGIGSQLGRVWRASVIDEILQQ